MKAIDHSVENFKRNLKIYDDIITTFKNSATIENENDRILILKTQ